MGTFKIKDGIYSVGVQNPNLRVFDIIMKTEFGTSYNAYLVQGSEKTALIETCHLRFFDEYLENVTSLCDIGKIDYIVMNHNEPDHSGSIRKVLELNPDITLVSSFAGINYLKNIVNHEFKSITAKDGDTLELGGKTLKFVNAPLLHWPDSMFTYVPEDKLVFTCDFLGAHFCEPRLFDKHISYPDYYEEALQYYYNAIFGPFKKSVLAGLDKLESLDFDTVCTSHGPVLQERIKENMEKYRTWSEVILKKNDPKKVPIFYVSAYGCTRKLAQTAQDVLKKHGFDCEIYDVIHHDMGMLKEEIDSADAFMLGSPTINRDALKPIWDVLSCTDAIINKGKQVGVFGSYGWTGEAVPMLVNRVNDLKLKAFENGLKVCFVPNEEELKNMEDYTERFAQALK